jgi:hypothetical protein
MGTSSLSTGKSEKKIRSKIGNLGFSLSNKSSAGLEIKARRISVRYVTRG